MPSPAVSLLQMLLTAQNNVTVEDPRLEGLPEGQFQALMAQMQQGMAAGGAAQDSVPSTVSTVAVTPVKQATTLLTLLPPGQAKALEALAGALGIGPSPDGEEIASQAPATVTLDDLIDQADNLPDDTLMAQAMAFIMNFAQSQPQSQPQPDMEFAGIEAAPQAPQAVQPGSGGMWVEPQGPDVPAMTPSALPQSAEASAALPADIPLAALLGGQVGAAAPRIASGNETSRVEGAAPRQEKITGLLPLATTPLIDSAASAGEGSSEQFDQPGNSAVFADALDAATGTTSGKAEAVSAFEVLLDAAADRGTGAAKSPSSVAVHTAQGATLSSPLSQSVPHAPVFDQVALHVRTHAQDGGTHFSVQLEPGDLGRVDIRMDIGGDGKTTVSVFADRQDTLTLLQRDARGLEKVLEESGIQAESGSLSFQLRQQNPGNPQQFAGQPYRLLVPVGDEAVATEEMAPAHVSDRQLDISI